MSTRNKQKDEVEGPVKKGPALVISLVFLLVFLLIIGYLLVSWYVENVQERMEEASGGRVLVSGLAVLALIVLLLIILVNILRGKKRRTASKPTKRKKSPIRTASSVKRKKTRKTT